MVLGCRLAVTSFLPVAGCFCFGSFSFCVLGAHRLFYRCCFCRWCLFFSVSLYVWVWLTSLGFFFCWGLFCGDCFLLCVWLMMAFVGCWCVGFVVFRGFLVWLAFAFSVLLPFLPSYPTFAWFGDFGFWPTAAFCLLLSFFNDTSSGEIYTLSLHDALPCLFGGSAYL